MQNHRNRKKTFHSGSLRAQLCLCTPHFYQVAASRL
ncbi:rCG63388 [Rattus norvegicus]|uniref:RCG63388 n=1 Tax=Rattus norvegicus TaxID=10116 RepID=A6JF36_RAT|nr:rCG63388 [Rattus norvegicus]